MPKLRMLRGPESGQEFELIADTIQIGRGRKNEIIIHDNEVSREHCRLVRVLDDYELHDLNSTNGTYVNGQPIEARGWLLNQRQIIELGDSITLEYLPSEDVSITSGTAPIGDQTLYYLVIKRPPPYKPRITPLRGQALTVGRATDNDISINVLEMSRHHMRLINKEGSYIAEDLNSTNGTMLNGEKLTQQIKLENGDVLQIGESLTMVFTNDPADASKPPDRLLSKIATEDAKTEQLSTRQPQDKKRTTNTINATSPLGMLAADANKSVLKHGLEPNQLVDHVMMVYSRPEWKTHASKVFTYLQNRNLNVWTDQYLLPSSQDWQVAFDQAISECPALLVILTKYSIKEDHVKRAIRYFQSKEKTVALLQFGDIPQKPIIISNMHTINFDEKYPANAYEQVIAAIERMSPIKSRVNDALSSPVLTTDTKPRIRPDTASEDVEAADEIDRAATDRPATPDTSSAKAMPVLKRVLSPDDDSSSPVDATEKAFILPASTEDDNKIPTDASARERGLEMLKALGNQDRSTDETQSVEDDSPTDPDKPDLPLKPAEAIQPEAAKSESPASAELRDNSVPPVEPEQKAANPATDGEKSSIEAQGDPPKSDPE
ncbi:MAG: FHA domain-containing protein [Anaerolineae bacterium]|nr:FHA domain-containing protein [Anaerolineae bacterium]